jgi:toxin HigB-1
VIRSFADATTQDIWDGTNSKAARRIPRELWSAAQRKLDLLNRVSTLEMLRMPPGNHLHALTNDQAGRHAIRINTQYRVTFGFANGDAFEVRGEDYHD